jgi:hypothetical protein
VLGARHRILREGKSEHRVDLLDDRIVGIEVGLPHHGFRNAGILVGVAGDVLLILAAAVASSAPSTSCEPSGGMYVHALPIRALDQSDVVLVPRGAMALAR